MVQAFDKFSPSGSAGDGWIERCLQDQLGLLERILVSKVPQELKEAHVSRQGALADPAQDPQVRLEQGKQALHPILVDVTTRIFLLRVVDELVYIALHRQVAAGGVCVEPTTRSHRDVGSPLHRLSREISGRLYHTCPLAADPRDNGRSVFVIMAPPGLALLATLDE